MSNDEEPYYGMEGVLYCPTEKRETPHIWLRYFKHYSNWECTLCGRVVVDKPYLK